MQRALAAAPNLVLAGREYNQQYMEQLTNQLRLYFNAIDNDRHQIQNIASAAATLTWLGWGN